VLFRGLITLSVLVGVVTPVNANTDSEGRPTNIPGIDYPIIPGVNAPLGNAPAGTPALNPDGSLVNPPITNPDGTPIFPGTPSPLPPPLYNLDGTPFVPGSPLPLPPGSDASRYRYEFDPLTNMYVPLLPGAASPQPLDPFAGLMPLAPPLFNQDGTPFVAGSALEMPVRADGTKLEWYQIGVDDVLTNVKTNFFIKWISSNHPSADGTAKAILKNFEIASLGKTTQVIAEELNMEIDNLLNSNAEISAPNYSIEIQSVTFELDKNSITIF